MKILTAAGLAVALLMLKKVSQANATVPSPEAYAEPSPSQVSPEPIGPPPEKTIYAQYEIPLYTIINRKPLLEMHQQLSSFGASLEDFKKIDLNKLPAEAWRDMGFDLAFSIMSKALGPAGWILSGVDFVLSNYIYKEESFEDRVKDYINQFKGFPAQLNVTTQDGLFLGTLARNRINPSLVPMVTMKSDTFYDTINVTMDLMPLFSEAGYKAYGVVGFVSTLPFDESITLNLMFNFALMDFVTVTSGSEYEKILLNLNYLPVVRLGYASRTIQSGPSGIVTPYDEIDTVSDMSSSSTLFALANQDTGRSTHHLLKSNIALPMEGTAKYGSKLVQNLQDIPLSMWGGPVVAGINRLDVSYLRQYYVNPDVLFNYRTPASDNAHMYSSLFRNPVKTTYSGLTPPMRGTATSLVLDTYGNEHILVHQLNGAVLNLQINKNISVTNKLYILAIAKELAQVRNPEYVMRRLLGPYLVVANPPYYQIDDPTKLLASYNDVKNSSLYWPKLTSIAIPKEPENSNYVTG